MFWGQITTINFLLANADLIKISVFVFFDKTYLQKPHWIMIENITSDKNLGAVKIFLKK